MAGNSQGLKKGGGPVVVLLAGAKKALLKAVRTALSDGSFELHDVSDLDGALAYFDEGLPDVLVTVDGARGLEGDPLSELLRSREGGWMVPVLSLVPSDDVTAMEQALALGATDIIPLPVNDITLPLRIRQHLEMEKARVSLAQSRIHLENVQSFTGVGTWEWRRDSGAVHWSSEADEIFGIRSEPEERNWEWFLSHVVLEDRDLVTRGMQSAVAEGIGFDIEHRIRRADRSERYVRHRGRVVQNASGRTAIVTGAIQDITSRKLADETIRSLAYYDHLTGLPNRVLSKDRLELAVSQAARHDRTVGFLVFDVDGFKRINGSMSHAIGDQLLEQVATRLQHCVRDCDVVSPHEALTKGASISRLGGDEFAILLTEIDSPDGATRVARRVIDSLEEPFVLDGNDIFITASIGISVYPLDGDSANSLVEHAVTALGSAKAREGNSLAFFDSTLDESARRAFLLESGLHRAIRNEELYLCFQPKVWASSGEICGMEALLRWNHPELG
ncbi:MAG: diguanylate cyclase, partial [Deltaproteobacteria bacterium]|nr:diguanylate cyclase [Deltaproteobacteria bacterium]